uniref:SH2 domain-containing protein n=1 Tax=Cyprinus carpio TaxID=7962 RepID=A0A8C1Y4S4_CYPCA
SDRHRPHYSGQHVRAAAEELLARAGRDGSFLVRDSESVNGAYALYCNYDLVQMIHFDRFQIIFNLYK